MAERERFNPDKIVSQLETEQLEEIVHQHNAALPPDWKSFTLLEQRRAVSSLMRGGISAYGFSTLQAGWLDEVNKLVQKTEKQLEEISSIESLIKAGIDE